MIFSRPSLTWATNWPAVEAHCGHARALALYCDEIKFFNDNHRKWIPCGTGLKPWLFDKTG